MQIQYSISSDMDDLKSANDDLFLSTFQSPALIDIGLLVNSARLNPLNGFNDGVANKPAFTRTNMVTIDLPVVFFLDSADYLFAIWTYTTAATASAKKSPTAKAYISKPALIYPAGGLNNVRFGFCRIDGANLTTDLSDPDSDYSKIKSSVRFFNLTDEGLSLSGVPADAFAVDDKTISPMCISISSANVSQYASLDDFPKNEIACVLSNAILAGLQNYPFKTSGFVFTFDHMPKSNNSGSSRVQIVWPVDQTQGMCAIRARASAGWTQFRLVTGEVKPLENAGNMKSIFLRSLQNSGHLVLGSGDFYLSELDMPDGTEISGSGPSTRIILSGESETYAIKLGVGCKISNLTLLGQLEQFPVDGTITHCDGIRLVGNGSSDTTAYQVKIENVEIANFSGSGLLLNDSGQDVNSGAQILNCIVHHCNVGINIPHISEYHRITNTKVNYCWTGVVNNGGNNYFTNCGLDKNVVCVRMWNEIVDGSQSAPNNSHGAFVGCSFHHSAQVSPNGDGTILEMNNMISTEMFVGCYFGQGKVNIANSNGIVFSACTWMKDTFLNLSGTGSVLLIGNVFSNLATNPTISKNDSDTIALHIVNCYNRVGAIRSDYP